MQLALLLLTVGYARAMQKAIQEAMPCGFLYRFRANVRFFAHQYLATEPELSLIHQLQCADTTRVLFVISSHSTGAHPR